MKLPVIKHEDERRILTEYISNIPFKRAKVLETKDEIVTLGKHYHENNDSVFYMLKGKGNYTLKSVKSSKTARITREWMFEGDCIFVPRGIIHIFELLPNSIMLETSSEPYDPKDEIQVTD